MILERVNSSRAVVDHSDIQTKFILSAHCGHTTRTLYAHGMHRYFELFSKIFAERVRERGIAGWSGRMNQRRVAAFVARSGMKPVQ